MHIGLAVCIPAGGQGDPACAGGLREGSHAYDMAGAQQYHGIASIVVISSWYLALNRDWQDGAIASNGNHRCT